MTSGRDNIFAKHLPNIKLIGDEVDTIREDEEQNSKQQEILDLLVASGYFRARIKGLSPFDKIVGGITWCLEACDVVVDVDLLFHENLTIGQKISLTEKIVNVLPKMKCPYLIEPHQIQGLDYIQVFPLIQWLVKRSVENRAEKSEKLRTFAIGQFHNNFDSIDGSDLLLNNVQENIKKAQNEFGQPKRQYKRKQVSSEDENVRVRMTILEYGNMRNTLSSLADSKNIVSEDAENEEIQIEQLFKNLSVANEDEYSELNEDEKKEILKQYATLKSEMSIDSKALSEQKKLKSIHAIRVTLETKLKIIKNSNDLLKSQNFMEEQSLNSLKEEKKIILSEIREFEAMEKNNSNDLSVLETVEKLVKKNEILKKDEAKKKDEYKQELFKLQMDIEQSQQITPDEDVLESQQLLQTEISKLKFLRLQLAKKNRSTSAIQRQLDNIPDRTELGQYQRRFLELYNQVSSKHRETKQFYTLYNTLDDTKLYLEKELSLLNSIYENYNESTMSQNSKDEFMKQFENILDGIKQTKNRVKKRCDDLKLKQDGLNSEYSDLNLLQRKYVQAIMNLDKFMSGLQ